MINDKVRDEIAIAAVVAFFIFIGGLAGWTARGLSTRDKVLQAVAAQHFAQAEYYQAELNQLTRGKR